MENIDKVVSAKSFDLGHLKAMIKELNGSGLLSKKIGLVPKKGGKMDLALIERFIMGVESVSDKKQAEIPEEVVLLYNAYALVMDEETDEETDEIEVVAEEVVDEVKEEEGKALEPEIKKKTIGKESRYGHRVDTQAAKLDDLFYKGTTIVDAVKLVESTPSRVKGHIDHLIKKKGLKIVSNDAGVYKVA